MENSKILSCSCEHKFQDEMYGKQKRVHARMKQMDAKGNMYRCGVCLKEKSS